VKVLRVIAFLLAFQAMPIFAASLLVTLPKTDIVKVRTVTSTYPTVEAKGIATVYTSVLAAPCSRGLWLDPESDKEAYSTLLAGVMSGKDIEFKYETTAPSPWGDNAWCRIDWISIINN